MNTFGHIFRLTSFGESHGPAMGGVIDGVPAGMAIDLDALQRFVDRRHPAGKPGATTRSEPDRVEVLSGLYDSRTLGTPIGFIVRNRDARSEDYDKLRDVYRPSHADYTYHMKYGLRDHRGGGRASGRETVTRMVGGGIALQLLASQGIRVQAFVETIGSEAATLKPEQITLPLEACGELHCPDEQASRLMQRALIDARQRGDTLGCTLLCIAQGVPAGWGEPVAAKLHADLGAAMLSINAAKGFAMGCPDIARRDGSQVADLMAPDGRGGIRFEHNFSGGVQGGISNGADIYFRVSFKPVPTLMRPVATVDTRGQATTLQATGRHDVCVALRALPVVEAMTAMVLLDHCLLGRTNHLF